MITTLPNSHPGISRATASPEYVTYRGDLYRWFGSFVLVQSLRMWGHWKIAFRRRDINIQAYPWMDRFTVWFNEDTTSWAIIKQPEGLKRIPSFPAFSHRGEDWPPNYYLEECT